MKKITKVLSCVLLASMVLSGVATAAPIEKNDSLSESQNIVSTITSNEDYLSKPIVEFDPKFKEMAKKQGLDPSTIIAGYKVIYKNPSKKLTAAPFASDPYYIKDGSMDQITGNVIHRASGVGPAPLSMQYSTQLSSTFSTEVTAEAGWDGAKLAGKLGASFTVGETFTDSYGPINVPKGKKYTIYCAPTYNYYTFDLWKTGLLWDSRIGSYYYKEPTGLYFYYQDVTGWG